MNFLKLNNIELDPHIRKWHRSPPRYARVSSNPLPCDPPSISFPATSDGNACVRIQATPLRLILSIASAYIECIYAHKYIYARDWRPNPPYNFTCCFDAFSIALDIDEISERWRRRSIGSGSSSSISSPPLLLPPVVRLWSWWEAPLVLFRSESPWIGWGCFRGVVIRHVRGDSWFICCLFGLVAWSEGWVLSLNSWMVGFVGEN